MISPKCFYCGSTGPFNKEHVFPYALGGGGDDWTLIDCVCVDCNNMFSSIERALARNSLEALPRTAYGPVGRKRKGNLSRMVPLYTDGAFLIATDSDLAIEAGLEFGFKPYIRAQIIENSFPQYFITGSDHDELECLFSAISKLGEKKFLTIETPTKKGQCFKIAELSFQEAGDLVIKNTFDSLSPMGAWYENFFQIEERRLTPRIFLDDERRLVLRAESPEQGVRFLGTIFRVLPDKLQDMIQNVRTAEMNVRDNVTGGNQLVMRTKILPVLNARAVAKIGMNFLAKVHGVDIAMDSSFDEIKSFIYGEIHDSIEEMSLHVNLINAAEDPLSIVNADTDKHWAALLNIEGHLLFALKFYGSGGYMAKLGRFNLSKMRTLPRTADIFSIDYSSRKISLLGPLDVIDQYKQNFICPTNKLLC